MSTAAQIRVIHTLKGKIAHFGDDDYRAFLSKNFRVASSRDLTDRQADTAIGQLRALAGEPRRPGICAAGKYAPVLRALWLSAHALGLVDNADDAALIAFVRRQTGMDHIRFLTDSDDAAKAIEALKAWMTREAGVLWPTVKEARDRRMSLATARKQAILVAQSRILIVLTGAEFNLNAWLEKKGFDGRLKLDDAKLDKAIHMLGGTLRAEKLRAAAARRI